MSFTKKGFTLIELLVVIAIISVLSSIVLSQLNEARAKARDARRISDLKSIQTALELYRTENGEYPRRSQSNGWATSNDGRTPNLDWNNLFDPEFETGGGHPLNKGNIGDTINNIAVDPLNTCNNEAALVFPKEDCYGYYYKSSNNASTYNLVTRLETDHSLACKNVEHGYVPDFGNGIAGGPLTGQNWCAPERVDVEEWFAYVYALGAGINQ